MQLWTSCHSLNQWKSGVAETDNPQRMGTWLESGSDNAVQVDDTDYKKAIFVSECIADEPAGLVQETKNKLLELHEYFLLSNELYSEPTFEEHD